MKHGSHQKRGRGNRPQNRKNPANRNHDSQGPDVRIRGTAVQIYDKYVSLARDASSNGDRVLAENYLQHAEHYCRIMIAAGMSPEKRRNQNQGTQDLGVPTDRKSKKDKGEGDSDNQADDNQDAQNNANDGDDNGEAAEVVTDADDSNDDAADDNEDGGDDGAVEIEIKTAADDDDSDEPEAAA